MITVKIFNNEEQIEEFEIMMLGGGNQGVGGASGYDYVLMKPKHPDMPPIAHKPEDGDLALVVKTLYTYLKVKVSEETPQLKDNIIQFPIPQNKED
jgi:hypothetical protein